jgi:probable HAF family extracellular repeat protein
MTVKFGKFSNGLVAAGFGLWAFGVSSMLNAAPQHYIATDLGSLNDTISTAYDINNAGWVVGYSASDTSSKQAVLWKNGEIYDLGTIGGTQSIAIAINNAGQVVGASLMPDNSTHIFLWENGAMKDISTPDILFGPDSGTIQLYMYPQLSANSSFDQQQVDINDAGQVVMRGWRQYTCAAGTCWELFAAVYENGQATKIPVNMANSTLSINSAGQISGYTYDSSYKGIIFDSRTGAVTELPNLGTCPNYLIANSPAEINDAGAVVGYSCTQTATVSGNHGYIWDKNSGMTDIGVIGTNPENEAYPKDVNNAGQVVGTAVDKVIGTGTYSRAFYYDKDGIVKMDDIVDNLRSGANPGGDFMIGSLGVYGINDAGVIVGSGYSVNYQTRAVVMTPVGVCP